MGEELGQAHRGQAARLGADGPASCWTGRSPSAASRLPARQVWEWAARGAPGYEEMTNLPLELREALAAELPFSSLRVVREAKAADGTEKALFETGDGRPVEAVLMRYRDGRRSLCLSSQSGCPLTCTFCATGQMQFGRNLTTSEILDQALHFRRVEQVNHAVFMGMGEPLMNLDAVLHRLRAAAGARHRDVQHGDLDRGLDTRNRANDPRGPAGPPGVVASRGRRGAAKRADAGERALPAGRGARGMPGLAPRPPAPGVRRIPDARRRERPPRAGAGARRRARAPARLQGQPDPVQPDRRSLRGVVERTRFRPSGRCWRRRGSATTVRLTRGREIAAACGQLAAAREHDPPRPATTRRG